MAATAPCRVLLVDNYDSYTFNLFQRLLASGATGGLEPIVIANDQLSPYAPRRPVRVDVSPLTPLAAVWPPRAAPTGPRSTSCCPTSTPSCSRPGPADRTARAYAWPSANAGGAPPTGPLTCARPAVTVCTLRGGGRGAGLWRLRSAGRARGRSDAGRVPRSPGPRPRVRRTRRAQPRGLARPREHGPPRRPQRAPRGHPARLPGGPLPLAARRRGRWAVGGACRRDGHARRVADTPRALLAYGSAALAAGAGLPPCLEVLARSDDDGAIMALAHTARPLWGVQFHPESVCTEHGDTLLRNFAALAHQYNAVHVRGRRGGAGGWFTARGAHSPTHTHAWQREPGPRPPARGARDKPAQQRGHVHGARGQALRRSCAVRCRPPSHRRSAPRSVLTTSRPCWVLPPASSARARAHRPAPPLANAGWTPFAAYAGGFALDVVAVPPDKVAPGWDAEALYHAVYADDPHSFWLDSARVRRRDAQPPRVTTTR